MATIYHVTTKAEWDAAQVSGFYEASSLALEGFIHCSHEHQVNGVLERYFSGKENLVKLVIDADKLNQRLQYDFSATMNESFPHVYGRINLDAVCEIVEL